MTRVERFDGSLDRTIANGGVETLPSPDGRLVAYLAWIRAGGRTSDAVARVIVVPVDGSLPRGLNRPGPRRPPALAARQPAAGRLRLAARRYLARPVGDRNAVTGAATQIVPPTS